MAEEVSPTAPDPTLTQALTACMVRDRPSRATRPLENPLHRLSRSWMTATRALARSRAARFRFRGASASTATSMAEPTTSALARPSPGSPTTRSTSRPWISSELGPEGLDYDCLALILCEPKYVRANVGRKALPGSHKGQRRGMRSLSGYI